MFPLCREPFTSADNRAAAVRRYQRNLQFCFQLRFQFRPKHCTKFRTQHCTQYCTQHCSWYST
jgi:hypothetical protein